MGPDVATASATAAAGPAHKTVGSTPRTQARGAQGRTTNVVQQTAFDIYAGLDFAAKGLMGEHIVEHYVIEKKNWGLQWNRHDMSGPAQGGKRAGWQTECRKINDGGIPIYLCTPSSKVLANGIDSLWLTNRSRPHQYAVVEAKASMNPKAQLYQLLGEANGDGAARKSSGRTGRRQRVSGQPAAGRAGTPAGASPPTTKVMQMSDEWIRRRITEGFPLLQNRILLNYSRHVFLVSPLQASAHIDAMQSIISDGFLNNPKMAQKYAPRHATHEIEKEFGEQDLDDANKRYLSEGKYKRPTRPKRKP
jgi:hypothetical protein